MATIKQILNNVFAPKTASAQTVARPVSPAPFVMPPMPVNNVAANAIKASYNPAPAAAIAKTASTAKPVSLAPKQINYSPAKPVVNTKQASSLPNFTPAGGAIGTQYNGYAYTGKGVTGWEQNQSIPGQYNTVTKSMNTPGSVSNISNTTPTGGSTSTGGGSNIDTQVLSDSYNAPSYNYTAPALAPMSAASPSIASMYGGATTGGKTTLGGLSSATSGDMLNGYGYEKTPYEQELENLINSQKDLYRNQSQSQFNEESVKNDTLRMFQAEIDATNRVFADKLNESKQAGDARLQADRAINFNAGGAGSSFANASQARTEMANQDVYQQLENQKLAAISQIQSKAGQLANEMYQQKLAARKEGGDALYQLLNAQGAMIDSNVKNIASDMIQNGVDINSLAPNVIEDIAKKVGTTPSRLIAGVKSASTALEFEQQKLANEAIKSQPASVQEYEYAVRNGYAGSYADYQNEDANRKAAAAGGSAGGLTPYQQFQATQSIAKDTQKRTENAREMVRQANMIDTGYQAILNSPNKKNRSLQTQAIITSFNKILDPTSVVRESEYDRTAQGQSLLQRLQGKVDNITTGGAGVTEATLKEAAAIAKEYLANAQQSVVAENQRAVEMANQFGLNPSFVTSSFGGQGGATKVGGVTVNTNVGVTPKGGLSF